MQESFRIAEHIANTMYDDIPSHVIDVGKRSLLDSLGVMLAAGTLGEGCNEFVQLAIEGGGRQESKIIGFGTKVPAHMAAFANGSMSHALDFEDTHDRARVHPNAVTIPAALAVAESLGNVSGREFLTAVVLGSDLVCRLSLALKEDLLKYGWYMPPILSALGATVSVAKLLRLSPDQILDALSLTLCQATCSGELTNSPKSVVRSIRDAFPAQAAVLSGLLAKKGITGFNQPLEGKQGFFMAYARGNYDPDRLTSELGIVFESENVSFKPWPCCRGTHSYVEAALKIANTYNVKPHDIQEIKVWIHPMNEMLVEPIATKRKPATAIDAKFSIPFVIATTFLYRTVTLEHFFLQALGDPAVLALAQKVTYEVDNRQTLERPTQGMIRVTTGSGNYSMKIDHPTGDPLNPIDELRLFSKFADCARYSRHKYRDQDISTIAELVAYFQNLKNVSELTHFL